MNDFLIHMAVTIILATIKNPQHAAQFKAALLKIRNEINSLYPGE